MSLPYSLSNVEHSKRKEVIASISNLKEQLIKFGYNPLEVDYIARKYAGAGITDLQFHDLKKLEVALKQHLDIAIKCLGVR